jgi:phosphohistidine phosphatase SixA
MRPTVSRCDADRRRQLAPKLLLGLLAWLAGAYTACASEEAWAALKQPGHVILMRHANAPGISIEPEGIDLKNCAIQRNLDEAGRDQSRKIGADFRRRGFKQARVMSSLYCRSLETARLLGLGPVESQAVLNYINFTAQARVDAAVKDTMALMKKIPSRQLAILVTHISNVKAITDVTPASGEMVVVRFNQSGGAVVAGRIAPP